MKLLSTITTLAVFVLGIQAAAIGEVTAINAEEPDTSPVPNVLLDRQVAGPTTFNEWTCFNGGGGGGHNALRNIHAGFNRVFGNPRLTAARGQCYIASCNGYYFAWCNTSGYTKTEASNHRNFAKDANPGSGDICRYVRFKDTHSHYYFGKGSGVFGGNQHSRRQC